MRTQLEIAQVCGWELAEGPDRLQAAAEIDAAVRCAVERALALQVEVPAEDALAQALRTVRPTIDRWTALAADGEDTGRWCVEVLVEGYCTALAIEPFPLLDANYTRLLRTLIG
jgi:hypothetical protein